MGWEERGGKRYYYRKHRVGSRVVSEYIGGGEVGELADDLDRAERQKKANDKRKERLMFEEIRRKFDTIDELLDPVEMNIRDITGAYLLVQGYHTHKGQWRRMRDGRKVKRID